jgi:hypothetical protein
MQQLKIEHKNTTKKDIRPGKGRAVALSRDIYRLQNTDTFYVESETSDDHYYFVKFKPDVFDEWYCNCKDHSIRNIKCKHLFAIEFAIKWGIIKDIEKVPSDTTATETAAETDVKLDTAAITTTKPVSAVGGPKSYKDDDYSF